MTETIDIIATDVQAAPQVSNPGQALAAARGTWNWSVAEMRNNTNYLDAVAQTNLLECVHWCLQHGISRQEFGAQTGIDPTTIYKLCKGTYINAKGEQLQISAEMLAKLERWLSDQRITKTLAKGFVMTPTVNAVQRGCALAMESRTPVFLYGPSQIGKTIALSHFARPRQATVIYLRMSIVGSYAAIIQDLAKALHLRAAGVRNDIFKAALRAMTRDMLVIIDEAHELLHNHGNKSFFKSIEIIREIYDRVGCGMILSFTDVMWDRIVQDKHDEMQQLLRRGIHRICLGTVDGMPLREDAEAFLGNVGLHMPAPGEMVTVTGTKAQPLRRPQQVNAWEALVSILKEDGIKSLTERLRYAKTLADRDCEPLTWQYLALTHRIVSENATKAKSWIDV